jgi:hypothetical protein
MKYSETGFRNIFLQLKLKLDKVLLRSERLTTAHQTIIFK